MQGQELLILSTLIGNVVGYLLKNHTNWQNRIIPYVQIALALGKNLLVGAGLLPAGMTVLGALGVPAPDGYALADFSVIFWFVLGILFDAALPIGVHSMLKNTRQVRETKPKRRTGN